MLKKTCMLGLVTIAAGIGFISAPVRAQNAASVEQTSSQYTTQLGRDNSAVNANLQRGIVSQKQVSLGSEINAAHLGQGNSQGALHSGRGNTSVQGSVQNGTINENLPGLQKPAPDRISERRPRPAPINPPGISQPAGNGVYDLRAQPDPHSPGG